jgi:transcription termination/antitermination protein NusG
MAQLARGTSVNLVGVGRYGCYGTHPWYYRCSRPGFIEFDTGLFLEELEALMSVQEPQDQLGRESVEDEIEESQDSVDEAPLSDSDSYVPANGTESVDAPTDESTLSSDDSTSVEEVDDLDIPAIESMPVSSSDELPAPEPTEEPAWYVIHCYSGYENKVRHNLEQRIETMGMKDKIFDVVIPTQEEIEVKDGKRRTVERHIFPGYVLVNMALTEESWYVVRNTPGVTGFVGMGNNPTPLRPEEVAQIVKRMEAEAPTIKVTFKVGERVRIIDGPFNDFRGVVSEIDMERTKVRVMVSFFGRETPVELDFLQVEKA